MESILALSVALSIASERLVEVVKGLVPWLNEVQALPRMERRRKLVLQVMAVVAGVVTAYLASDAFGNVLPKTLTESRITAVLGLGLLASGGSGLWNALLGYALQVKDLKKTLVQETRERQLHDPADGSRLVHRDLGLADEQVTSNECYDVKEA